MTTQNSSEEISVGQLFGSLRRAYHSLLIKFYHLFQFLLRNWIILLALLIGGIVGGYFWNQNKKTKKETTLIVRVNYNSVDYVYNAVDQLFSKVKDSDEDFLSPYNFFKDGVSLIRKIEIEPVVSVNDILEKTPEFYGNIDLLIEQTTSSMKVFTSDMFVSQFKTHKIDLRVGNQADNSIIDDVVVFLNDNEILQNAKETYKANLRRKIEENQYSVTRIDSILQRMGTSNRARPSSAQVYVHTDETNVTDLRALLQEKTRIMNSLEEMEVNMLNYDEPVIVLNKPVLKEHSGFFSNKVLWLPIALIMLFLGISWLSYLIKKAKYLAENQS